MTANQIKALNYKSSVTAEEQKLIDNMLKEYPMDRLFAKRPATMVFLMSTLFLAVIWGFIYESLRWSGVNIAYQLPIDGWVFAISGLVSVVFIGVLTFIGVTCREVKSIDVTD